MRNPSQNPEREPRIDPGSIELTSVACLLHVMKGSPGMPTANEFALALFGKANGLTGSDWQKLWSEAYDMRLIPGPKAKEARA